MLPAASLAQRFSLLRRARQWCAMLDASRTSVLGRVFGAADRPLLAGQRLLVDGCCSTIVATRFSPSRTTA